MGPYALVVAHHKAGDLICKRFVLLTMFLTETYHLLSVPPLSAFLRSLTKQLPRVWTLLKHRQSMLLSTLPALVSYLDDRGKARWSCPLSHSS
jgi:hypothetical protein